MVHKNLISISKAMLQKLTNESTQHRPAESTTNGEQQLVQTEV